ncbi:MAG: TadE/TadG family type IV pilus assembly protein [Pseudomonadota bacterium]
MSTSLVRRFRRFASDIEGLVTIQVLLFSVMLFGAIGFVIDFGRAYSAHSQMQSYIDQVALAAASELDQRDGRDGDGVKIADTAIERATAAASGVSKTSIFTQGGGDFQIAQLIFLAGPPTDANGMFDYALVTGGTLTTTDPVLATHVVAIAQPASVRASLLDISVGGISDSINEIPIGAYAVATRKQVTCEGISTLVMCNPFENDATRSLNSVFDYGDGFRLRMTASQALGLSSTATQIGVGLIKNPVVLGQTDSGACEEPMTLPGYAGQTGAALEALRDKCLLAVVDTGLTCVNDELIVKEAAPDTVVTGLNVRFDLYDAEMAEVLTADPTLASGPQRSEMFYPDIAAVHGMIRYDEVNDYYNALIARLQAENPGPMGMLLANQANAQRSQILTAYSGDPARPASRQNHIPVSPGAHGPMESPPCFESDCLAFGLHGAIYGEDIQPVDYAANYYLPSVVAQIAANDGIDEADVTDIDGEVLTGSNETFYAFYSNVERLQTALHGFEATQGEDWNGIENYFVRTWPENFAAAYPSVDMSGYERRRMRVSVVDCGARQAIDAGDGLASFMVDVVDVVDVFMTRPPVVETCATAYTTATDPRQIRPCENSDITEAELHVEYVGSVLDDLRNSRSRSYAVLVH